MRVVLLAIEPTITHLPRSALSSPILAIPLEPMRVLEAGEKGWGHTDDRV